MKSWSKRVRANLMLILINYAYALCNIINKTNFFIFQILKKVRKFFNVIKKSAGNYKIEIFGALQEKVERKPTREKGLESRFWKDFFRKISSSDRNKWVFLKLTF